MKTIGEVLNLSVAFLQERGIERGRRIVEDLLAAICSMPRMDLYMQFDKPVEETELAAIREGLKRCAKEEPVEYVVGEVPFYGCKIAVDRRVLIPRPETEILVETIAKREERGVLWDICAGSGCIGISLKRARPALEVTLADISPAALELAAQNATANGAQVKCVLGDLLEPMRGMRADIVVCNPPYVKTSEYLHLQRSVRDFEPRGALVGGERGVEFYERLAQELPAHLNPGARVYLEIGDGQADAVKKIFEGGPWARTEAAKDWSQRDRFFFLEMQ